MIDSAGAQSSKMRPADGNASTSGTATSFGALQQIDAGDLNVGYAEAGPADGSAVVLLHGWPYDIHSFVEVAPLLAAAGYRVVVPYFRGFGTTRFRSDATFRTASKPRLLFTSLRCWTLSRSTGRSSPASTGEPAQPTSSRRSGPNAAPGWCR